jgi:hypothetical protein
MVSGAFADATPFYLAEMKSRGMQSIGLRVRGSHHPKTAEGSRIDAMDRDKVQNPIMIQRQS